MSLREESNDRREFDSTKQSLEITLNLSGLLRRPSGTPRNDVFNLILFILQTLDQIHNLFFGFFFIAGGVADVLFIDRAVRH